MQARGGGSDDLEWGVDLRALVEHKTHGPAEKVVVIAERQVSKLHVIQDADSMSRRIRWKSGKKYLQIFV